MARGLDGTLTTAVGEDITRPYYLVYLGFDTPEYKSTVANISWNSQTWVATDIEVMLGANPVLKIFNEGTTFGQTVLGDGTTGRTVQIYEGYQNDSAHPSPEMVYDGELADATIGADVILHCKPFRTMKTPRHAVIPPTFNHIPPAGTQFVTPKQTIILAGD